MLELGQEVGENELRGFADDGYLVYQVLTEDEIAELKQDIDQLVAERAKAPVLDGGRSTAVNERTPPPSECYSSRSTRRSATRPVSGWNPGRAPWVGEWRSCRRTAARRCRIAARVSRACHRQVVASSSLAAGCCLPAAWRCSRWRQVGATLAAVGRASQF